MPIKSKNTGRILKNDISHKVFYLMGLLSPVLLIFIFIELFQKSFPIIEKSGFISTIFSSIWQPLRGEFGLLPFIISSFYVSLISLIISVPICLLAAIYISEYSKRKFQSFFSLLIDILAGMPSVIIGVWGVITIVPFIKELASSVFNIQSSGYSIISGGIVLSVILIPNILYLFIEILKTIPVELKEATLSLGATKWETIKYVVVRKSFAGLAAAVMLGFSRALGETLAVLMVVGNVVKIPQSIFDAGYPLPALIANNYGEMFSIPLYDSALMYSALILLLIIVFFNIISRLFIKRVVNKLNF